MKKYILIYLFGFLSASTLSVFASFIYQAKDIEYHNLKTEATNLQDILDELIYNRDLKCKVATIPSSHSSCSTLQGCVLVDNINPKIIVETWTTGGTRILDYYNKNENPTTMYRYIGNTENHQEFLKYWKIENNQFIGHNWGGNEGDLMILACE